MAIIKIVPFKCYSIHAFLEISEKISSLCVICMCYLFWASCANK